MWFCITWSIYSKSYSLWSTDLLTCSCFLIASVHFIKPMKVYDLRCHPSISPQVPHLATAMTRSSRGNFGDYYHVFPNVLGKVCWADAAAWYVFNKHTPVVPLHLTMKQPTRSEGNMADVWLWKCIPEANEYLTDVRDKVQRCCLTWFFPLHGWQILFPPCMM